MWKGKSQREGFDGVNEELWTCCGQPYVDFSKVEMEGSMGCRVQLAHTGVNDERRNIVS